MILKPPQPLQLTFNYPQVPSNHRIRSTSLVISWTCNAVHTVEAINRVVLQESPLNTVAAVISCMMSSTLLVERAKWIYLQVCCKHMWRRRVPKSVNEKNQQHHPDESETINKTGQTILQWKPDLYQDPRRPSQGMIQIHHTFSVRTIHVDW